MTVDKHWTFKTSEKPCFIDAIMSLLSIEEKCSEPSNYHCYVKWKKKQRVSAVRRYSGKKTKDVNYARKYKAVSKKNRKVVIGE